MYAIKQRRNQTKCPHGSGGSDHHSGYPAVYSVLKTVKAEHCGFRSEGIKITVGVKNNPRESVIFPGILFPDKQKTFREDTAGRIRKGKIRFYLYFL